MSVALIVCVKHGGVVKEAKNFCSYWVMCLVAEILLDISDEFDEVIDFFGRVIEIKARARGGLHA